jgi:hypothetical protein
MSKRVIATCSLLLLLGVAGGLDSLAAFSRGQVHINLLILLLPVAISLFVALPGARLGATIVFSILYLFLALLLLAPMIGPTVTQVQFFRSELPFMSSFSVVLVFVAMLGSVLALLHWMLFSPPFEEHLNL